MTNTTTPKSVRAVHIAAAAVAIASIVCAGAINVSAESAPRSRPSALDRQRAAELEAIADWARSQGFTGLSPASLHPIDARQIAELQAVEDWARSHCLTGLSPASLQPTDAC